MKPNYRICFDGFTLCMHPASHEVAWMQLPTKPFGIVAYFKKEDAERTANKLGDGCYVTTIN